MSSCDHPGSSDQGTGVHTLRACVITSPETAGGISTPAAGLAVDVDSGQGGALEHADSSVPTMHNNSHGDVCSAVVQRENVLMWLFLVEALAALLILVLIVWWTMFSGRKGGEPDSADTSRDTQA